MFDLPTETAEMRRNAARFRNCLMDVGFVRVQNSVYMRYVENRENVEKYVNHIKKTNPNTGDVCIMFMTDKQSESSIKLSKNMPQMKFAEKPEQCVIIS
jgi:CRISPR-associated protein Cas2